MARWELRKATQILRAGRALPTQRGNPRKRGPGKAVLWAQSARRPRPRWRFVQSLVTPGEAQRNGFAGKRRSKGTNAVFAARRKRSGVDFATTSRHGQSNPPRRAEPCSFAGAAKFPESPPKPLTPPSHPSAPDTAQLGQNTPSYKPRTPAETAPDPTPSWGCWPASPDTAGSRERRTQAPGK